jgi:hypothetical protein
MIQRAGETRLNAALACVLLLVIASALVIRLHHPQFASYLNTDEADYASALRYGALSNYLGWHERTGLAFIEAVFHEYRATGRARPFRDDWRTADAAGMRHYHPPFGLLPAAIFAGAGIREESVLRSVSVVLGLLACVMSGLLAVAILGGEYARWRWPALVLACALVAASPYQAQASAELSFHAAFGLISTAALVLLTLAKKQGARRYWLWGCALIGAAAVTIPYWVLLLPVAAFVLWRSDWNVPSQRIRLLLWGLLIAAGACTIAWPPGLLTLNLVKPAMLYAWILISPLEGATRATSWYVAFARDHQMLMCGIAAALCFAVVGWRTGRHRLVVAPVLIFIGLFVLLNIRVWHMKPLYTASVVPSAAALAGAGLAALGARYQVRGAPVLVAIVAAIALINPTANALAREVDTSWRAPLQQLRHELAGATVLVVPRTGAGTMRWYLDHSAVVPGPGEPNDELEIQRLLGAGKIDAILVGGNAVSSLPFQAPFAFSRLIRLGRSQIALWLPAASSGKPATGISAPGGVRRNQGPPRGSMSQDGRLLSTWLWGAMLTGTGTALCGGYHARSDNGLC